MKQRHAIIVGGGLGGLTAAIAMKKIGWKVSVFERAAKIAEVGAGIQTWANASNAMEKLGILDAFAAAAEPVHHMQILRKNGRVLIDLDITEVERETGYYAYSIHRHEFIEILRSFLEPEEITLNAEFESFEQRGKDVIVRFAGGMEVTGDLFIGADGINSTVRRFLFDARGINSTPRYAGYIALRGVCDLRPKNKPLGYGGIYMGEGYQTGFYPLTNGRSYWFVTINTPQGAYKVDNTTKADIMMRISHWAEPVPQLIEATPAGAIVGNSISDYMPRDTWGEGRMTLLGDSAHATTPNIGQGICMAVEDSVSLASVLQKTRDDDIPIALREWEKMRFIRTKAIVNQSYIIGKIQQLESPFLNAVRDTVLGIMPSSFISSRTMEIYRHQSPELIAA